MTDTWPGWPAIHAECRKAAILEYLRWRRYDNLTLKAKARRRALEDCRLAREAT